MVKIVEGYEPMRNILIDIASPILVAMKDELQQFDDPELCAIDKGCVLQIGLKPKSQEFRQDILSKIFDVTKRSNAASRICRVLPNGRSHGDELWLFIEKPLGL